MAVHNGYSGNAAAAVPVAGYACVGVHAHDNLPKVGAPGRCEVLVLGIDGFGLGDFHGESFTAVLAANG